jgi:hypothetical protein
MYCRFYLLVNPPILYLLLGLSQQPSPTASLPESLLTSAPPSTSKWELFSFVCLVAQPCQSCDKGILELWESFEKEWNAIPAEMCQRLVESMPRRVAAVYKAKGGYVKY